MLEDPEVSRGDAVGSPCHVEKGMDGLQGVERKRRETSREAGAVSR